MVTSAQLQIFQSPITSFISTVSSSVNVKLDDSNYLTWNFQIDLLLEGHGLTSFMHDRALMQLIIATLSPLAVSCAIGSTSARDLWVRLKEQFSIVTQATIFQMKSELQNIKKDTDSISQYLQRIKEAWDYLVAAGVHFDDDDIVILTLNGLPSEYNTLRSIIRGRENVISMKDLRPQLLVEEAMVDNVLITHFLFAMVARNNGSHSLSYGDSTKTGDSSNSPSYGGSFGFKSNYSKNKNKGKFQHSS
ncbi:unnamed protein product [Malus baccata var. baccata]